MESLPRDREKGDILWTALDVQKEADRLVLSRYSPVGVVIDEALSVLQFRGRTSAYLEPAPGLASLDLLKMLREGLLAEVRSAINQARAENNVVTREGLRLVDKDQIRLVKVEVLPFKVPTGGVRCFLVLFQDMLEPRLPTDQTDGSGAAPPGLLIVDPLVLQLQQEMSAPARVSAVGHRGVRERQRGAEIRQ